VRGRRQQHRVNHSNWKPRFQNPVLKMSGRSKRSIESG
jgi:hypothetical protein